MKGPSFDKLADIEHSPHSSNLSGGFKLIKNFSRAVDTARFLVLTVSSAFLSCNQFALLQVFGHTFSCVFIILYFLSHGRSF